MANKFSNNAEANLYTIRRVPVLEQLKRYESRLISLAAEHFNFLGQGNLDGLVKNLKSYSQVSNEVAEFLINKGRYLDHNVYAKFKDTSSQIEKLARSVSPELARINESAIRYQLKNLTGSMSKNLQSLIELTSK
ncbi:MAG: hypothetical protein ACXVCY_09650 [Pseudobdellovibrionaceae bacterium]